MERKTFDSYIKENLIPIVQDEVEYLKKEYPQFTVSSKLLEYNTDKEFDKISGEIYYNFDRHKLMCKDYLGEKSVRLDRHKMATVFMFAVCDSTPIDFFTHFKSRIIPEELALCNYRVAFRFACAYDSSALYTSFIDKIANPKKEDLNAVKDYERAADLLKENGALLIPKTRSEIPPYVDSYLKILYKQYEEKEFSDFIPYAIFSDTFYWIDIYNKIKLGLKIESLESNALRRNKNVEKL